MTKLSQIAFQNIISLDDFFIRQIHLLAWVFYSAGQIAIFNPLDNFDASLST